MIKGKLVVIDNLNLFKTMQQSSDPIPDSAVVFIKNEGQIWTKGSYFGVQKTYTTVSKTDAGLAPKGGDSASSLISNVDTEWVLTVTSGASPSWRKLPANAFKNTTYTFYNLAFKNSAGTTVDTYKPTTSPTKTVKAGSNVTISASDNVITIAATDTTYSVMGGASANADGTSGLVPQPTKGNQAKFLRADGSWATPTNTTYSVVTAAKNGLVPMFDAADGTIDAQDSDWVLTNNNGSIGWYKLPTNAFNNSTYSLVNNSSNGLVPILPTTNSTTISNQANEWVLTTTEGGEPSWRKLPTTAFYSLPTAKTNALGGIKVGSVSTSAFADLTGKYYTVNVDKNGVAYVNVPWTDDLYTASGNGISLSTSKEFNLALNSTSKLSSAIGGTIYALSLDKNGKLCVSVPWANTWRNIYVGGVSKVGTANNTKAINFEAGDNISITHLASGTSSGQSGSTSYSTIKIANTYSYSLPTASSTLGGVKTTSTVTSTSGLTACPIIDGVVYYKDSNSNTWRGIYIAGTSKMGTATSTKALNFAAGDNVTISYAAPGTSSGQSGNANYGTLTINATNTWTAWKGATSSASGTAGYMPAPTSALRNQFLRGDGTWQSLNNYSLPTASSSTLGGVKTGAAITDTTGYTAVHIKDGVIYYKDTNSTNYLPLSGGTLNGLLVISNASWGTQLTINRSTGNGNSVIQYTNNDNGFLGCIGIAGEGSQSNDFHPIFNDKDKNEYRIYHSGNLTKLSQLTDDVVSGKYLSLNGGTLNGRLYISHTDNDTPLVLIGTSSSWIHFTDSSQSSLGYIGFNTSAEPAIYKGSNSYKIWYSGNDGSGSGLDADLLDGLDSSMYGRYLGNDGTFDLNTIRNGFRAGKLFNATNAAPNGSNYRGFLEYGTNGYTAQFNSDNLNNLYYRWCEGGTWKDWRTIAFTDSNVASATKLQTARTIWGQSFDGSGNVSGSLSGVTDIFMSGSITLVYGSTNYKSSISMKEGYLYIQPRQENVSYNYNTVLNSQGGNVGIGTTSPAYKLDVSDTMQVTSYITGLFVNRTNPEGNPHVSFKSNGTLVGDIGFTPQKNLVFYDYNSGSWKDVLNANNYTSYTVTKTGGGASGLWGINISGYSLYMNNTGNASNLNTPSAWTYDNHYLVYDLYSRNASNKPVDQDNANSAITLYKGWHGTSGAYATQIAFPNNEDIYIRKCSAGSWGSWRKLYHSGNFSATSTTWNGGAVSNTIYTDATPGIIVRRASGVPYIRFTSSSGTAYGELGANTDGTPVWWYSAGENSAWRTLVTNVSGTAYNSTRWGGYSISVSGTPSNSTITFYV